LLIKYKYCDKFLKYLERTKMCECKLDKNGSRLRPRVIFNDEIEDSLGPTGTDNFAIS
jgi:hypothetical protein